MSATVKEPGPDFEIAKHDHSDMNHLLEENLHARDTRAESPLPRKGKTTGLGDSRGYDFWINKDPEKKDKRFKSNQISTCKYTWWNFLPKNLMIQFSKLSNAYFLMILIL